MNFQALIQPDVISSRRLAVVSRTAAAVLGGYALTYAATACVSLLLPLEPTEAVLTAQMLAFALYTAAILAAFAARTARRAWAMVGLPAAVLYLLAFAPRWLGA